MESLIEHRNKVTTNGFTVIDNVYSSEEISLLIDLINSADSSKPAFRKSETLFAIRQFLNEIPSTLPILLNKNLSAIISNIFGKSYFVVKSIYFDKPEKSNWYVTYHQDLTISVDRKIKIDGFGPWTTKQNQFAVQPPVSILEKNFTVRIHLDDTDENNGALRVIPKSHLKNIYRAETIDWSVEKETSCVVKQGGIMIMKPLLLHASSRTTNSQKRRVIHIEFSNQELPDGLNWSEKIELLQRNYYHQL